MSGYTTLLGAEQVQRAGHSIDAAASRVESAASQMTSAAEQMQRNMDDWLLRFEQILREDREARITDNENLNQHRG